MQQSRAGGTARPLRRVGDFDCRHTSPRRRVGHEPLPPTEAAQPPGRPSRRRTRLLDECGATVVEYALMLALIALICIIAIQSLGANTASAYQSTANAFTPGGGAGKDPPPGCGEGEGNKGPMCP